MRIVFMGTPDFAVPVLKILSENYTIEAVVTQPDRAKGRRGGVQFPPVKELALSLGKPILQPEKVRDEGFIAELKSFDADIFVVVAYGQIVPKEVLLIPPLGCVNIHASILPKYRGAAPMQRAILNGDSETGVTIMYMDEGMDTGDMIYQERIAIEESDIFADLQSKMMTLSCECIIKALGQIESGTAAREQQDNTKATYAPMLTKEDGLINWNSPTSKILNQVRALDPWPGTYCNYQGQVLKVWGAAKGSEIGSSNTVPGQIIESGTGLLIKTADSAVSITEVQGAGGKRMSIADYLRGHPIPAGTVLG